MLARLKTTPPSIGKDDPAGGCRLQVGKERIRVITPTTEREGQDERHQENPYRVVPVEKLEANIFGELVSIGP